MFITISVCCDRRLLYCANYVRVENILSIITALILLYFDNLFLGNPYICLRGSISGCSGSSYGSSYSDIYDINSSTGYTVKMACIKAQLACAPVILVTNVVYIVIFIIVAIKTISQSNQIQRCQYGIVQLPVGAQFMIYQTSASATYVSTVSQQHH